MANKIPTGTANHVEPERSRNFGSTPRVGQSRPYVSGSNAHNRHEKPREMPREGRHDGGSSVTQESGYRPRKG